MENYNYIEPIRKALEEGLHRVSKDYLEVVKLKLGWLEQRTPRYMNFGGMDGDVLTISSTQSPLSFLVTVPEGYENPDENMDINTFWNQFKEFRTKFLVENYPEIDNGYIVPPKPSDKLKDKLIQAIDLSGYEDKYAPTLEGLRELFLEEFFHVDMVKRTGGGMPRMPKIATEWFRGLGGPSFSELGGDDSLPYLYVGTNALMKECGYPVEGMGDVDVDDLYWSELGKILMDKK